MTGDFFSDASSAQPADVAALFEGMGWQGVRELIEAGALVSIGLTRDGGAIGFTVTVDGDFRREYFRRQDELLLWIAQALPAVEARRGSARPTAVDAPRSRPSRKR